MRVFLGLTMLLVNSVTFSMAQDTQRSTIPSTTSQSTISPEQLFEPRDFVGQDGHTLQYRLLKPLNFEAQQKYPLVIFLHGAGERGDDNLAQLKHGMRDFCTPERREKYACYVLAPQCPAEQKWADIDWTQPGVVLPDRASRSLQLTFELVDAMLQDAAIDKNRIYITGLSMGGYGTWDALARRPDFFAAAIPICGGGDPATADAICHVPIACFHGAKDEVVDPSKSRAMIAALEKAGGKPRYTEYAGVGHDSWTQTYAADSLFAWLFEQRKKNEPKSDASP